MPFYTFFSFYYDDVKNFKVNIVRDRWLLNNSSDILLMVQFEKNRK